MSWLSGLKIKKNILLEQQPLASGDDAELAAMRRMVMDDALKRKSMAQRVGITAYIKNRPQVDASVVKNVVANVSSFNRYRSEKDYEEWVIRERERAARLKASRSQDVGEHLTAQSSCSDDESSVGSRAQELTGAYGPSDEETALRRQVKERVRRARAGERERAPDVDYCSSKSQEERALEGGASNSDRDGGHAAATRGQDLRSREHDKHRDRSRDRHRHGGKHREDGGAERGDEAEGDERKKHRAAHGQREGDRDRQHDSDKHERRKERHRHRDDGHDKRGREERERSGGEHSNR
jgi:hypothetical protein